MKACFADNGELPIACAADIGEEYNCQHLASGKTKASCPHWKPVKTMNLCLDILGMDSLVNMSLDTVKKLCRGGI